MKKYLSYVLSLLMLISCILIPEAVGAENVHASTDGSIKYWLDMGVQQVWTKNGLWDGQIKPGQEIDIKSNIHFSKPVEIVGYYTVESSSFKFADKQGIYNYNHSKLIFDESSYQRSYGIYKSAKITPISATASGNTVTINYKAVLKTSNSAKQFNLAEELRKGEKVSGTRLWTLLGGNEGKNGVKKYNSEIYQKWQSAYDKGIDENVQAYLYFTPTVIAYREITTKDYEVSSGYSSIPCETVGGYSNIHIENSIDPSQNRTIISTYYSLSESNGELWKIRDRRIEYDSGKVVIEFQEGKKVN